MLCLSVHLLKIIPKTNNTRNTEPHAASGQINADIIDNNKIMLIIVTYPKGFM